MQAGFFESYEKASNWLRLIGRSEIRVKMLTALNGGPKDLSQLRELLDLSSSTIIHSIGDMEDECLVEKRIEKGYSLTNIGNVQALLVNDLMKVLNVLSKNSEFWLTHDLSGIPDYLLKRVGDLQCCKVIKSSPDDVFKVISNYDQLVKKANWIKGVSPIFYTNLPSLVEELISKNITVELVITRDVMKKVVVSIQDYMGSLKKFVSDSSLKLWVMDKGIKVAFTVTDSAFSFGLFNCDGTYDVSTDLVSEGDCYEATNWGRELFEYYRVQSKKVLARDISKYVL